MGHGSPHSLVVFPVILPNSGSRKQQHFDVLWETNFSPGHHPLTGTKDREIHAIRDHSSLPDCWGKNRSLHLMHQPPRGRSHIEPAVGKYFLLCLPVVGSRIPLDRRIDSQVGAMTTARFPTLTVERVSTMTTQEPRVVQGKHDRNLSTQPGQSAQIEISTVQVMTMDQMWSCRWQIENPPGGRKVELFVSAKDFQQSSWLPCQFRPSSDSQPPPSFGLTSSKQLTDSQPTTRPRTAKHIIWHDKDIRVITALIPHSEPRSKFAVAICVKKPNSNILSPTTHISGTKLQNAQVTIHFSVHARQWL